MKQATEFEQTLLWSSMRYFMRSRASASWPADFMTYYESRISRDFKYELYDDLKHHFHKWGKFGNEESDSIRWEKLMNYLSGIRYEVIAEGNGVPETTYSCFRTRDKFYEIDKYKEFPSQEIYVYPDYIKGIKRI